MRIADGREDGGGSRERLRQQGQDRLASCCAPVARQSHPETTGILWASAGRLGRVSPCKGAVSAWLSRKRAWPFLVFKTRTVVKPTARSVRLRRRSASG